MLLDKPNEQNQRAVATSLHEHWVIFLVEWMLASAIIDLTLAAIIFAGLPGSAAWALGLLLGITIMVGGLALIAMALHAREIDPRSAVPAH